MKLRWKVLGVVISALAVALVAGVVRHYQLKARVSRYRAELKAHGEPINLDQVLPGSVPPEQNRAQFFTNACALLGTRPSCLDTNAPPAMRAIAPGKAMVGWKQPAVLGDSKGASNSWEEVEAALAAEKPGLDLLRQLPPKPVFDFALNYSAGFSKMGIAPLAPAKRAAVRLNAALLASLRQNDGATAARDVQATLSIVQGLSHDRVLISELVRIAIVRIALAGTWEYLQSTNVAEGQLRAMQSAWEDLEFLKAFENSLQMERAVERTEAASLRGSGFESYFEPMREMGLLKMDEGPIAGVRLRSKTLMWRYWWSYPDELRYLQGIQAVIEMTRQIGTNAAFVPAQEVFKKRLKDIGCKPEEDTDFWSTDPQKANFHSILSSSMMILERALLRATKGEAGRRMTVTAIALKRFESRHGKYPERLSELASEGLASVPLDPMDGQPLRYRLNPDGTFLLYSVGEDGKDDGGDPRPAKEGKPSFLENGRDWVWPQPATESEIQKYFTRQAVEAASSH